MSVYQSSSVQLTFDFRDILPLLVQRGLQLPDSVLYTDPKDPTYGRVGEFHATVLYGVPHVDLSARVQQACARVPIETVVAGPLSYFPGDEYEVLHLQLYDASMDADPRRLRKALLDAFPEVKDPFMEEWQAHITVAYLKPGSARGLLLHQAGPWFDPEHNHFHASSPGAPWQAAPSVLQVRGVEISRLDGIIEMFTPDGRSMEALQS